MWKVEPALRARSDVDWRPQQPPQDRDLRMEAGKGPGPLRLQLPTALHLGPQSSQRWQRAGRLGTPGTRAVIGTSGWDIPTADPVS